MLGRFHEIGIQTADIRASVEFYERLGFSHATASDTWSHPYGVLTDGRVFIALHQKRFPSPVLTFVRPGIADRLEEFERQGIELTTCHTGHDIFNEIGFQDPFGQPVTVLEARTYSPPRRAPNEVSLCGWFGELSLPVPEFETVRTFWEALGFVATDETDVPYVHLPLISDHINISFHRPRTLDRAMLVFRDPDMPTRIARLRELGVELSADLPRGLKTNSNALIEAPEGTALLLLQADS